MTTAVHSCQLATLDRFPIKLSSVFGVPYSHTHTHTPGHHDHVCLCLSLSFGWSQVPSIKAATIWNRELIWQLPVYMRPQPQPPPPCRDYLDMSDNNNLVVVAHSFDCTFAALINLITNQTLLHFYFWLNTKEVVARFVSFIVIAVLTSKIFFQVTFMNIKRCAHHYHHDHHQV